MPDAPQLLFISEVCAELHSSRSTVYRILGEGRLQSMKVRGRRVVSRTALDAYMASVTEGSIGVAAS